MRNFCQSKMASSGSTRWTLDDEKTDAFLLAVRRYRMFVSVLSRSASSSAVFSWTTYDGSVLLLSFLETDRRAGLFLRLNTRFVNEFDKFMAETTATAAVAENMSLTMDAMFAILIQFSCKLGMKWPSHHVNVIRNHEVIPVWNSRRCEFSHGNTP